MNWHDELKRDEQLAERLNKLREINARARNGEIDELERIRLHNEVIDGLGDAMEKDRIWGR